MCFENVLYSVIFYNNEILYIIDRPKEVDIMDNKYNDYLLISRRWCMHALNTQQWFYGDNQLMLE